MKKEIIIHFLFLTAFFLLVSVFRLQIIEQARNISISSEEASNILIFWIGGIIGTLLPDVDHFIYIYLLRPHEVTSRRVGNLMSQKNFKESFMLLGRTNNERTNLVFHNAIFQLIFVAFAFFIVTSAGSYLGLGLVLAFLLHIIIDQVVDLTEKRTIHHWFVGFPVSLTAVQQKWYVVGNIIILLVLGLFL